MVIWETVDGELTPLILCDCCGWDCSDGDYEDVGGMILCPNCIRQNNAENIKQEVDE